jgi:alpha-glucosidase (family GH31 glycosyl hydrolase)
MRRCRVAPGVGIGYAWSPVLTPDLPVSTSHAPHSGVAYAYPVSGVANDACADPAAMLIRGPVRFTVLTPRLIRIEWDPDKRFNDAKTPFALCRSLPVPAFGIVEDDERLTIDTGMLRLDYIKGDTPPDAGNLRIAIGDGEIGDRETWTPASVDDGNLGGTYRTLDRYDGDIWQDGTRLPMEDGILSRRGWYLLDDSRSFVFDAGGWIAARNESAALDLYFFGYGLDFRSALGDFAAVSGPQPMPPRYVFGYWWSRYWNYSDRELRSLVARFERERIPLDVLVLDMDWHTTPGLSLRPGAGETDSFGEPSGWTGYTFNRSLFPDPPAFLAWAHGQSLKVTLNLHPASGVPPTEEHYVAMAGALGMDASAGRPVPFEAASKPYMRALFDTILHPLERQGVDFWWLDYQQWPESRALPGLSNTWWLNHAFFNDMQAEGDVRGLIYHRWGGLGNHRYPIGFSGDSVISWDSLAYQPHFTATASNVLYGYWSHDIGGHTFAKSIPKKERRLDPELYTRWVQYGVFSPVLRTHSAKEASLHKEPWHFGPPYGEAITAAIRLRYRLVPYIYSAARDAYDTGVSLVRPMYYDWPDETIAYEVPGQYMFGDALLVAPVTVPMKDDVANVGMWLPPGTWCSRDGAESFDGGRMLERGYMLGETPVFIRAGSVLPLYPDGLRNLAHLPEHIVLQVYPGASGQISLYDDDGTSQGYRRGDFARTAIHSERVAKMHRIAIDAMRGDYVGRPDARRYTVELLNTGMPEAVHMDGYALPYDERGSAGSWRYDSAAMVVCIELDGVPLDREHELIVHFDASGSMAPDLFHHMKRAAEAGAYLKTVWDDISALTAEVDLATQASQVLAYAIAGDDAGRSRRFAECVSAFDRRFAALPALVSETPLPASAKRHFNALLHR